MKDQENEILGTAGAVLFALLSLFATRTLAVYPILPAWLSVVIAVVLCGVSGWALYKVGKYWVDRMSSRNKND